MTTEQTYHLIIHEILTHPTKLGKIFVNHAHCIDQKLLVIMKQKSHVLSEQGNQQGADFLNSLIIQLQEELTLHSEKKLSLIEKYLHCLRTDREAQALSKLLPNPSIISSIVDFSCSKKQRLKRKISPSVKNKYDETLGEEYEWSKWVAGLLTILLIIWGGLSILDFKRFQFLEQEWSFYLNSLQSPSKN
ncbi:MAG: hypothetical protein AB4058_04425 [Microcystaceae cyanobacterium]